MNTYICRTCQKPQQGIPLSFGPDAPASWDARSSVGRLTDDLCEIDAKHFFVRGCLEIPILGSDQIFAWLVWSSLSAAHFQRTQELWSTPGRESEPPYFGWLNSSLQVYPNTLNLKVMVHTRPVGERPWFELEPTDHPLSVEQRGGITSARVHEIVHRIGDDGA